MRGSAVWVPALLAALLHAPGASALKYNTRASPKDGMINVHLVQHTHDDTGWLKTVDQDFLGTKENIQDAAVEYIIDTVVEELEQNPDRTFIYAEVAFFQRWWRRQSNATKDRVRSLVAAGQLEFVNGGWCMHDEAAPHYRAMIDQTTLGHRYLKDEVGAVPTIGWQIDPFGHSATHASLISAGDGFDGLFFARIDLQDHAKRKNEKGLEMLWRGSQSLGADGEVFTGAFYSGGYGPPKGFNWNHGLGDISGLGNAGIQDDPDLDGYNVDQRVNDFVQICLDQANYTRDNNILLTMGSDYNYRSAHNWFRNLDRLVHHVNLDGRVNVMYSTPSRYVASKHKANATWPSKEADDFFPYRDVPRGFWSGFFTSRPALKRYTRQEEAFLQAAQQMLALGGTAAGQPAVEKLWDAVSLVQHHDAITGTEKQHVAYDYAKRLAAGHAQALPHAAAALSAITGGDAVQWQQCLRANQSECEATAAVGTGAGAEVSVALWNALASPRQQIVRLPVGGPSVSVEGPGGAVKSTVMPSRPTAPYGPQLSGAAALQFEVTFVADLPALGVATYVLRDGRAAPSLGQRRVQAADSMETDAIKVDFSADGRLSSITDKTSGVSLPVRQDWLYYESHASPLGKHGLRPQSGAYLFVPHEQTATPVAPGAVETNITSASSGAAEARMRFSDWVTQTVRIAPGQRFVELEYTVGPVPVPHAWPFPFNLGKRGKEVVSRIETPLQTQGRCRTDSNGRDMLERRRDYRKSWPLQSEEPVAGNYFPVTTAASLEDNSTRLTLMTDAAQGGGSLKDGAFEIMVHRRLLVDDARGVGEPLNETEAVTSYELCPFPLSQMANPLCARRLGGGLVIRGRQWLQLAPVATAQRAARPLQDRMYVEAGQAGVVFLAPTQSGAAPLKPTTRSFLKQPLPASLQLVTLERLTSSVLLVRIAHQYGEGEDAELSKPASVDLAALLTGVTVRAAEELTLSANRPLSAARRLLWRDAAAGGTTSTAPRRQGLSGTVLTLRPMEVRTVMLHLA
eukprot:TRINITY_DN12907_c0_g1_i1.p1 TRINITY_DN12907_c0_g1~~TRINITY_DN12907_c0_g1_i1.p1  ORF type:complete len:1050 (+),score=264.30 TRINITY_DN12907_c0_g1_i1:83-3151(+)